MLGKRSRAGVFRETGPFPASDLTHERNWPCSPDAAKTTSYRNTNPVLKVNVFCAGERGFPTFPVRALG